MTNLSKPHLIKVIFKQSTFRICQNRDAKRCDVCSRKIEQKLLNKFLKNKNKNEIQRRVLA